MRSGAVPASFACCLCAILWLAHMAIADQRNASGLQLRVSVRPSIVMGGSMVRIECRVARNRLYQSVTYGIEGPDFSTSSTRELPLGHQVIYELPTTIPRRACGRHTAYCIVQLHDRMGIVHAPPQPILIVGSHCPEDPQ